MNNLFVAFRELCITQREQASIIELCADCRKLTDDAQSFYTLMMARLEKLNLAYGDEEELADAAMRDLFEEAV